MQRIHFWQHGHAVGQMLRAYPPGVDALVDRIRAKGPFAGVALRQVLLPLYFAREQGWVIPGEHGEMAAIMYLRRQQRQGIRVMHVDDINVDERYRHRGLAQNLMQLAEELALCEQRPFMKLAVTVANTPAVTLYRRLGYQEQHHHYLTYDATVTTRTHQRTSDVQLRPLGQRAAWNANRDAYRAEVLASDPHLGAMMIAYYSRGAGGEGIPKAGMPRYAIESRGRPVGYGDAYQKGAQWNLRLSLSPDMWGSEIEQQTIHALTRAVVNASTQNESGIVALHVPSTGHYNALYAGSMSLASEFHMQEQRYERMIMAKVAANESYASG
jgi:ribosomal protein S18 acetylase RimI-like enzyme